MRSVQPQTAEAARSERLRRVERAAEAAEAASRAHVDAVLRARAARLAQGRDPGKDEAPGRPVLCFRIAGERYALPLSDLAEVLALNGWTPVPGMPQTLLGVTNLRGEIRPVLDLHAMLNLAQPAAGPASALFLRVPGGGEVGLRVDGLDRILALDESSLTRPHESGNGLPQKFVAGIAPDALVLLDARQILAIDVLQDRRSIDRDSP